MDAVHTIAFILHMAGIVAIVVGAIAALISARGWALQTLVWGARAQVLTGIALAAMKLAGVGEDDDDAGANVAKLAVKLIVALAVAALAESAARRRKRPLIAGALVLALANAAIASMWH